jgi:hypothetical protein
MPRDVAESLTLVRDLARSTGIEISAVAHRLPHGGDHVAPELIDEALLAKLVALSAAQLPPDLVAIEVARTVWPDVPHVACFETAFDIAGRADEEAVLDRQARAQLQRSERKPAMGDGNDRADRMLAEPRRYFARARRRARAEITRDIAQRSRR